MNMKKSLYLLILFARTITLHSTEEQLKKQYNLSPDTHLFYENGSLRMITRDIKDSLKCYQIPECTKVQIKDAFLYPYRFSEAEGYYGKKLKELRDYIRKNNIQDIQGVEKFLIFSLQQEFKDDSNKKKIGSWVHTYDDLKRILAKPLHKSPLELLVKYERLQREKMNIAYILEDFSEYAPHAKVKRDLEELTNEKANAKKTLLGYLVNYIWNDSWKQTIKMLKSELDITEQTEAITPYLQQREKEIDNEMNQILNA